MRNEREGDEAPAAGVDGEYVAADVAEDVAANIDDEADVAEAADDVWGISLNGIENNVAEASCDSAE